MEVSMFGWKFPPFNSGGLDLACKGVKETYFDDAAFLCRFLFVVSKAGMFSGDAPKTHVHWTKQARRSLILLDGRIICCLGELVKALRKMTAATFRHHVRKERNELADWIRDACGDPQLAERARKVGNRATMIDVVEAGLRAIKSGKITD